MFNPDKIFEYMANNATKVLLFVISTLLGMIAWGGKQYVEDQKKNTEFFRDKIERLTVDYSSINRQLTEVTDILQHVYKNESTISVLKTQSIINTQTIDDHEHRLDKIEK